MCFVTTPTMGDCARAWALLMRRGRFSSSVEYISASMRCCSVSRTSSRCRDLSHCRRVIIVYQISRRSVHVAQKVKLCARESPNKCLIRLRKKSDLTLPQSFNPNCPRAATTPTAAQLMSSSTSQPAPSVAHEQLSMCHTPQSQCCSYPGIASVCEWPHPWCRPHRTRAMMAEPLLPEPHPQGPIG